MSYQVLARKWRPRIFKEMAGQEHVLKALINALDNDRLHHAYLFTGTRGVGKTTIARILAKCLNCERGVTSEPCGECGSCVEIAEGRFIDLIEVDAASRTKVEDTRELLDNVQYAPTRGRYKVYLIDEVHMLSAHSFNALLKTLEEPPPHVKFLLATTDPQKLPVTILSRCLQFNLKNLSPERISEHLKFVLGEEQIPCEEGGLWALARAADGSMRDALSLTDQAIAHGGGQVNESEVSAMLGTIDHRWVEELCTAVAANDGSAAMAVVNKMAEHGPDYSAVLTDVLGFWHRVAIAQTVPDALDNRHGDYEQVLALAKQISREDVQLCYQIALLGKRDLPLAPDMRLGFEMALLRQLAFKPGDSKLQAPTTNAGQTANVTGGETPVKKPEADQPAEINAQQAAKPLQENSTRAKESVPTEAVKPAPLSIPPWEDQPRSERSAQVEVQGNVSPGTVSESDVPQEQPVRAAAILEQLKSESPVRPEPEPQSEFKAKFKTEPAQQTQAEAPQRNEPPSPIDLTTAKSPEVERSNQAVSSKFQVEVGEKVLADGSLNWIAVNSELPVTGMVGNTAANLVLIAQNGNELQFHLDTNYSSLYEPTHQERIALAVSELLGSPHTLSIEVASVVGETPRAFAERKKAERQAKAVQVMRDDPLVDDLTRMMGGQLLEETVRPLD
jgi:DNA polymerase-3 subunit gamma/tau